MSDFESLVTEVPGPRSRALGDELSLRESRGVTFVNRDLPVFWESARGATVDDVDGNRYLDMTSAFGVANTGHSNPAVARAIAGQAAHLMHGMGDVHPSAVKNALLAKLASIAPVTQPKTFLCSSGSEAIEYALKTALLATGEPNVLAFAGAYHGLSYGTLEVSGIPRFRNPWRAQLRQTTSFTAYPDMRQPRALEGVLERVGKTLKKDRTIGCVLVEPIQGRAGVIIPPPGFLRGLQHLCKLHDAVLIVDEIYTGFGRTGTTFACEAERVRPDILCVGKAMAGGFPISAAIARGLVADAWEPSQGEALHTSTYLGNPMGCAAALANIAEFERLKLAARAAEGERLMAERLHTLEHFAPHVKDVRGRGMLWALEFSDGLSANACVVRALKAGLILLQSGLRGETITFAPPLVMSDAQLHRAFDILAAVVRDPAAA